MSEVLTRSRLLTVGAALVLQTAFGVVGTRDYLEHNRTRSALIRFAQDELGAAPNEIEGGFEFNGYENYDRIPSEIVELAAARGHLDDGYDAKRLSLTIRVDAYWNAASWPLGDRYVVSLSPKVEGYRVVRRLSSFRALLWKSETQYLHERAVAVR